MVNQKLCYLVKWEGFGVEHSSWEPWDNIHAPELVADFYQRHTLVLLATSVWSNFAPFLSIQCQVVTALKGGCVRGHSTSSDVSSNISPSPLYIPPRHC